MKRAVIISPYSGNIERNLWYLDKCLWFALQAGYAPFAGHGLYPRVLDDSDPAQRELGMEAAQEWFWVVDKALCFIDFGMSEGMKQDCRVAFQLGLGIDYRHILTREELHEHSGQASDR